MPAGYIIIMKYTKAPSTSSTLSMQQATLLKQPSTLSKHHSTLLPQTAVERVYRKISSFRQSRNKLNMFNFFDFVERTKFRSTLLPKTAKMSKQHSTLSKESYDLWHSTMLLGHCCWCGRGLSCTFKAGN